MVELGMVLGGAGAGLSVAPELAQPPSIATNERIAGIAITRIVHFLKHGGSDRLHACMKHSIKGHSLHATNAWLNARQNAPPHFMMTPQATRLPALPAGCDV